MRLSKYQGATMVILRRDIEFTPYVKGDYFTINKAFNQRYYDRNGCRISNDDIDHDATRELHEKDRASRVMNLAYPAPNAEDASTGIKRGLNLADIEKRVDDVLQDATAEGLLKWLNERNLSKQNWIKSEDNSWHPVSETPEPNNFIIRCNNKGSVDCRYYDKFQLEKEWPVHITPPLEGQYQHTYTTHWQYAPAPPQEELQTEWELGDSWTLEIPYSECYHLKYNGALAASLYISSFKRLIEIGNSLDLE